MSLMVMKNYPPEFKADAVALVLSRPDRTITRSVISQRPAVASQQQPPPALCGGKPELRPVAGSVPGAFTVTFSSSDGRLQFAVSTTLKIPNHDAMTAVSPDINKAAEAVFCPGT
jgi:hypothetical protein